MRTWKLFFSAAVTAALCLPATATASATFEHVVAPGESLSSVAATDGLSVARLAAANGLSPDAELTTGSSLAIPPQEQVGAVATESQATPAAGTAAAGTPAAETPAREAASASAGGATSAGGYRVQPGDTLWAIAVHYRTSVGALAADNGLNPHGLLFAGKTIAIPGSGSGAGVAASAPVQTAAPSGGGAGSGAQPTPETVSPSEVGAIAAANGVSPSLAEAIGDQESGFDNNAVSATGATGVMQIEPGTWNYIDRNLAGPTPLSPASATDNIRGGVLLLRSLLDQTRGNPELAAAGYYQGLRSVRAQGLFTDTQRYVADVMALRRRFGGP